MVGGGAQGGVGRAVDGEGAEGGRVLLSVVSLPLILFCFCFAFSFVGVGWGFSARCRIVLCKFFIFYF